MLKANYELNLKTKIQLYLAEQGRREMSQVKGTEVRLEISPEQVSALWVCWGNERGRQDKEHGRTFLHDILQLVVIV